MGNSVVGCNRLAALTAEVGGSDPDPNPQVGLWLVNDQSFSVSSHTWPDTTYTMY